VFGNVTRACLTGLVATLENGDMALWSRIAALSAAALATLALAGCGGDRATLATFAGTWQAHGRTLKITPTGNAEERISLGLGHFAIALRFQLSRPRGSPHDATATATVTAVRLGNTSAFTAARPPPRVGESRTIRLRDGVLTETLTGANYCGPTAGDWIDAGCGA
jgi:hypothetical protein